MVPRAAKAESKCGWTATDLHSEIEQGTTITTKATKREIVMGRQGKRRVVLAGWLVKEVVPEASQESLF